MTDIRPSPEMLDAIAANRAAPLEERDLSQAIADHRAYYHADLFIQRLHVRDGESGIGVPFSQPFENFLDQEWKAQNSYPGTQFPYVAATFLMRHKFCRSSHADHWDRPEWRGSLCGELVRLVIWQDWSFGAACYELYVDQDRTEAVMLNALDEVDTRRRALENKAREVVHADLGRQVWLDPPPRSGPHNLGGIHAQECPVCRGKAA